MEKETIRIVIKKVIKLHKKFKSTEMYHLIVVLIKYILLLYLQI